MSHLSHSSAVESLLLHHPAARRTFEIFYHHKESTKHLTDCKKMQEVQEVQEVHTYAFLCSCFGGAPETEPVSNPLLLSRSASYKSLHTSLCPALSISSPFILPLLYSRFLSFSRLITFLKPFTFLLQCLERERARESDREKKRERNECLLRRANTE